MFLPADLPVIVRIRRPARLTGPEGAPLHGRKVGVTSCGIAIPFSRLLAER
jgi:hypothetical protein